MRHNVPLSYRRQAVLSSLRSGFRPRPMARISSEPQAQISSPVRSISSAAGRFRYPIEPCTSSFQSMGKREPLVKRRTISSLGASSAPRSTPTLGRGDEIHAQRGRNPAFHAGRYPHFVRTGGLKYTYARGRGGRGWGRLRRGGCSRWRGHRRHRGPGFR